MEKLRLVGIQNFLERILVTHLKAIAHIYVLFISLTIRKYYIVLKTALLVLFLKWEWFLTWEKSQVIFKILNVLKRKKFIEDQIVESQSSN